jgi:hypothetical protein
MADINISDINLNGFELFADSESFLNELSDDEINLLKGGDWSTMSYYCGSVNDDEWSTISDGCR